VLSRYEKAIEYYEQTLAIYREMKDRRAKESRSLTWAAPIGGWVELRKRLNTSNSTGDQREGKNRQGEANALNNLAGAYRQMGRHEKEIEYFETGAGDLPRRPGIGGNEGITLKALAIPISALWPQ